MSHLKRRNRLPEISKLSSYKVVVIFRRNLSPLASLLLLRVRLDYVDSCVCVLFRLRAFDPSGVTLFPRAFTPLPFHNPKRRYSQKGFSPVLFPLFSVPSLDVLPFDPGKHRVKDLRWRLSHKKRIRRVTCIVHPLGLSLIPHNSRDVCLYIKDEVLTDPRYWIRKTLS